MSVGLPHLFLPPFFTWGETKRRISKLKTERMQEKEWVEKAVFSIAKRRGATKTRGGREVPGGGAEGMVGSTQGNNGSSEKREG